MAVKEIALDTNSYTALKRNVPKAIEIVRHAPLIGIGNVVLRELLGGFAAGAREGVNRQELKLFLASPRIKILVADEQTAETSAIIYSSLRNKGTPIPTNDMWIAAHSLQFNLALFSYDNHFQNVDGLVTGTLLAHFL